MPIASLLLLAGSFSATIGYTALAIAVQPYMTQLYVAQPYVAQPYVAQPYVAQPYYRVNLAKSIPDLDSTKKGGGKG